MSIIIDGIDFENLEAEKYWSFPSTYKGNKQEEMKNMIFSGILFTGLMWRWMMRRIFL